MVNVFKLIGSFYDCNAYLIKSNEAMLIDAGTDARAVLNQIRRLTGSLKYIVLTHFHHDHSIAAGEVARAMNAKILIHEDDSELLQDTAMTMAPLVEHTEAEIKTKPDILLKGGESLSLGDYSVKVIHTPGHSPGSICLYDSMRLFSGDTVFSQGNFGSVTMIGADTNALMKSIELLSELKVEILYPGHGDVAERDVGQQIKNSLKLARLMFSR